MWNDNLSPQVEKLATSIYNLFCDYMEEFKIISTKHYRRIDTLKEFWGDGDIEWGDEAVINYIINCSGNDGWLEPYNNKLSEEDKGILFSYAFGEK